MPTTHTKEQLWEIYKKLPEQIKEHLISEKISDIISNIYQKYNILEEEKEISESINQILFGIAPLEDFQSILKQKTKIKKDIIKNLSQEINRYVFFPVKDFLKTNKDEISKTIKEEIIINKKVDEKDSLDPRKETLSSDSYREEIE